jgi:DNA-binding response OmpR family regulator
MEETKRTLGTNASSQAAITEKPAPGRVLIVEDEPNMVAGLRDNFEFEGYQVMTAADGAEGLSRALNDSPDLILLDVMMPRMSGLDVCKQIKAQRPSIPVIMLTARGQEIDKVLGLELGADDYVTKPFSYPELHARIVALLRRGGRRPGGSRIRVGPLELDALSRQVWLHGQAVRLSKKEFALLRALAADPTRVFTREELLRGVWGFRALGTTRTLDSHACRLRRKLADAGGGYVINVWGVGYRLLDGGVE